MKISDIEAGDTAVIELRPTDAARFDAQLRPESEVQLYRSPLADETLLKIEGSVWAVTGADAHNTEILDDVCDKNLPRLCWLASQPSAGTRLVIQVHSFTMRYDLPEPLKIGVTDQIVEKVRANFLHKQAAIDEVLHWLTENVVVGAQPPAILISTGVQAQREPGNNFRIHGKRINIDVARNGGYKVSRVVHAHQHDQQAVMVLRGEFAFCDTTAAAEFRGQAHTLLDEIVRQSNSYLTLWEQYNLIELENILQKAREFGWLRYQGYNRSPDGEQWHLKLTAATPQAQIIYLRDNEIDLEVATDLPRELASDTVEANSDADDRSETSAHTWIGRCVRVDDKGLVLRPSNPGQTVHPPESGYIFVALTGDVVRLKRRTIARDKIVSAQNPMPQLGLLLEAQSIQGVSHRRIKLPRQVIRDVFGKDSELTPRQLEAIDLALNTPDIALIQGPPGTGKTRLIAAIERILARDDKSNENAPHPILLTSYQHDAVENAAAYTVLDLPPIKVGRRSGRQGEVEGFTENVERWRQEQIERLKHELENRVETAAVAALRRVQGLVIAYVRNPGSPQETIDLIREIFELTASYLDIKLREHLIETMQCLQSGLFGENEEPEERGLLVSAVRALRTNMTAFTDDGVITTHKLLRRLEGSRWLTVADRILLERAADWNGTDTLDFLPDLQNVQERLLDQLIAPVVLDRAGQVNTEVETLLMEVMGALTEYVRRSKGGIAVTMEEYLHDLEYNPRGIRRTLREYTTVLAATCQQAVSLPMASLHGNTGIEFDTVIIDEAARANPLDMMIPMSLAKRRIILVGDHRQLPHILELDVERQLEVSEQSTQDALRQSLFQRLFTHAQELERRDGIKRAITLDAQYRMHPILGQFVSKAFYPPEEQFGSPGPESLFVHDLDPYKGKVAVWIDVPYGAGQEKGGRSKSRPVEARKVATVTRAILDQRPDFSVGVITFYAAQEQEIWRELKKVDLAEEIDGGWQVAMQWGETRGPDGRFIDRLRVGTVDAFQGKEFDVVLLSMTRSNTLPANSEPACRRKYGFLTLENRLCVAMSRQKRLLIVIGDAGMLHDPAANVAVPGLKNFYDLCGGEYGLRL